MLRRRGIGRTAGLLRSVGDGREIGALLAVGLGCSGDGEAAATAAPATTSSSAPQSASANDGDPQFAVLCELAVEVNEQDGPPTGAQLQEYTALPRGAAPRSREPGGGRSLDAGDDMGAAFPTEAGRYSFVVTNDGAELHVAVQARLEDGVSVEEALAAKGDEGIAETSESEVAPPVPRRSSPPSGTGQLDARVSDA